MTNPAPLSAPAPAPSHAAHPDKAYHVLTHGGKPVWSSRSSSSSGSGSGHDGGGHDASLMGVAQALISIFAEDEDRPRSIVKGAYRIVFLLKAPLYLFAVSNWGEPEQVLRVHLEYIHLQILSVVSSTQLARAFERRSNFDPTRLLQGTESLLLSLVTQAQSDFTYLTSTLQPLRMPPALREAAAACLIPPQRLKDLLYVLLVADGRHIVTLLRPRKHSVHPADLHLVLNALGAPRLRDGDGETFLPICLPKFNAGGFVHAYISYGHGQGLGLVFVSADREAFEELRAWKEVVLQKLPVAQIERCIATHRYTAATAAPGLGVLHFIYKSRRLVQLTAPDWPGLGDEGEGGEGVDAHQQVQQRRRLVIGYEKLHEALRSGLKLVYLRTDTEAFLGWLTRPFELYVSMPREGSKADMVAAANTIAQWVAQEESRIFLKDAPVF